MRFRLVQYYLFQKYVVKWCMRLKEVIIFICWFYYATFNQHFFFEVRFCSQIGLDLNPDFITFI